MRIAQKKPPVRVIEYFVLASFFWELVIVVADPEANRKVVIPATHPDN